MLSLSQIEQDIKEALKARNQLAADTLRGLKVRIQNEKIAKMRDLSEEDIVVLVKSEVKRRKEAAESFSKGQRPEQAEKELAEAKILEQYLPEQFSEQQLAGIVAETITAMQALPADFGKVMAELKAKVGQNADGSMLAKLVKEKLK